MIYTQSLKSIYNQVTCELQSLVVLSTPVQIQKTFFQDNNKRALEHFQKIRTKDYNCKKKINNRKN